MVSTENVTTAAYGNISSPFNDSFTNIFTNGTLSTLPAPSDQTSPSVKAVKDITRLGTAAVAVESTALLLTSTISLVGHILVVIITGVYCKHWRVLHILLFSLSLVEMLTILAFAPLQAYGLINQQWGLPHQLCTFTAAMLYSGSSISTGFKTIIALSRLALSSSEEMYIRFFNKGLMILYMVLWSLVAIVGINVPIIVGFVQVNFSDTAKYCSLYMRASTPALGHQLAQFSYYTMAICYFLPTKLNAICYAVVYYKIGKIQGEDKERHRRDSREILISVVLAYLNLLICWIPMLALNAIDPEHVLLPEVVHKIALYLHLLNFASDPFVYAFRATDYKLGCYFMCHRHVEPTTGTDEAYKIDFNDLDEEYNNNLSEVLKDMREADVNGFEGIVKKQQAQKAKLRFQHSISQIIRDHRYQEHVKTALTRMRSQSVKGSGTSQEATTEVDIGHKFKRACTIVRVRDVMNLHIKDVVIENEEMAFDDGTRNTNQCVMSGNNTDQDTVDLSTST